MLTQFFLERPRLAQVIALVIFLTGLLCLPLIPTLEYPQVTPPQVEIKAIYIGATSDQVERAVATPLEREINGIENMLYMSSSSANDGSMTLTITFKPGTDPDIALMSVQSRLDRAKPMLPREVLQLGITAMKKLSTQLMFISFYSEKPEHDDTWISNFVSIQVKEALSRIPGVGFVDIIGKRDYSLRIWLDVDKMTHLGLLPEDVDNAIKDQHREIIAGKVGHTPDDVRGQLVYVVEANGLLTRPEEFANIPLRRGADGKVLKLSDIARIEQGSESYDFIKRLDKGSAIHLSVFQQSGANGLKVSKQIKQELERLSPGFPEGVQYLIPYDMSRFVGETLHELRFTLLLTVLLVVLVIFLFLTNWRSTLIPTVTIPVSLVGSFAILHLLGYSINTVTLFGLVLAVGIVVDDAIVVVENVQRQMHDNELTVTRAVIQAMKEVTSPVIATTLVLFAVFFPLGFIPGTAGHFYREFGVATGSAVLISCICALTLSPGMCNLLLRTPDKQHKSEAPGTVQALFFRVQNAYLALTRISLNHPVKSMLLFLIISLSGGYMLIKAPRAFVPIDDRGFFYVLIQLPDNYSLNKTDQLIETVINESLTIKGIENTVAVSGFSPVTMTSSASAGFVAILLKPWAERGEDESLFAVMGQLRQKLSHIHSADILMAPPSPIPAISFFSGFDFKLQDKGDHSPAELADVLDNFMIQVRSQSEITESFSTYRSREPRIVLDIDRQKLYNLDVKLEKVQNILQAHLGSQYVDRYFRYGRKLMILMQAEQFARGQPEDVARLQVRSEAGKMIPLGNLLEIRSGLGPSLLEHYNIYRTASISGQPADGYSIAEAMTVMEHLAEKLPEGYDFIWSGLSLQQRETAFWTALVLVLAILFAYLFMVAQFESWLLPVAVIGSVPIALFGAMAGLNIHQLDNNIYAQLGLILLIGLAAKNAILIVEFARTRETEGESIFNASMDAARLRFRAVLMTGLSFIFGVMPLLYTTGAGAQARKSLGVPVFWGMLAVVFLATLLTPALYLSLRRLQQRFKS